jgi:hypothetical protein
MLNSNPIQVFRFDKTEPILISSGSAPASADVVLAGNFTSTEQLPLSELLFYDAGRRKLSLFRTDKKGKLSLVKSNTVNARWDILVAGNFKGGGLAEVLLYDRTNGNAKFLRFTEDGDFIVFREHDWEDKWDIIVARESGILGEVTSLLFYDREFGHLKLYECKDGQLTRELTETTVERGWDTIVSGSFRLAHSTVADDLFFYDSERGAARLCDMAGGQLVTRKSYSDLPKNREVMTRGRLVKGQLPHEILLYDRDTGAFTVYGFRGDMTLEQRSQGKLPSHAQAVVPGNFVKTASPSPPFATPSPDTDELLLCGVHNRAVYLGWGGYVDTTVSFDQFFDGDHTVMCWFMPQFVHANYQPVIAENGQGVYMFGLGDYKRGNVLRNEDLGKEFNKAGDPVFFIRVGEEKRLYLVPQASEGVWIHLALVRKDNRFTLFLDGVQQTPIKISILTAIVFDEDGEDHEVTKERIAVPNTEIVVPGLSFADKPSGTLRIGRRSSGTDGDKARWQTYGLVDDVAVFTKAFTSGQLTRIVAARRLDGAEDGLLACWPFDAHGSDADGVFRTWTLSTRPSDITGSPPTQVPALVPVSASKSSDNDARLFSDPSLIKQCHLVVPLPFPKREAWKVLQGMNSALGSHMSSPAFCYDLILEEGTTATAHKPVFASVTRKVLDYREHHLPSAPDKRESNYVRLKYAADRVLHYLHLARHSLNESITGGTLQENDPDNPQDDEFTFTDEDAPELQAGELVGEVGPNAKHLHFGARATIGDYAADRSATIPVAFSNFELLNAETNTWKRIEAAFLRKGAIVRKP